MIVFACNDLSQPFCTMGLAGNVTGRGQTLRQIKETFTSVRLSSVAKVSLNGCMCGVRTRENRVMGSQRGVKGESRGVLGSQGFS